MSKLLIGMPTNGLLSIDFTNSLLGIVARARDFGIDKVETMFIAGVRTDRNRNQIVEYFLENNFDYLLFLDTDMVYPIDIVERYVKSEKLIMGGMYYKRSTPYYPVAYKFDNEGNFACIDPEPNTGLLEVDGIGTGGMFLRKEVFEIMKTKNIDYWFKYGDNYHLPYKTKDQNTHDLVFCRQARNANIPIFIDTTMEFQHIAEKLVTRNDWLIDQENQVEPEKPQVDMIQTTPPSVAILIPAYGVDAIEQLRSTILSIKNETEDYPHYVIYVEIDGDKDLHDAIVSDLDRWKFKNVVITSDTENLGYGKRINKMIAGCKDKFDYFIYLAQDVLMGKDWLSKAMQTYNETFPDKDGLLTFNDGKWYGEIACHGLVHKNFISKFTGETLFCPDYKHYSVDMELTHVAKMNNKFVYEPNSVVYHVQAKAGRAPITQERWDKMISSADEGHKLFLERKALGFPKH